MNKLLKLTPKLKVGKVIDVCNMKQSLNEYFMDIHILETSTEVQKALGFDPNRKLTKKEFNEEIMWNEVGYVCFYKEAGKDQREPRVQLNDKFLYNNLYSSNLEDKDFDHVYESEPDEVKEYRTLMLDTDIVLDLATKKFEKLKKTFPFASLNL